MSKFRVTDKKHELMLTSSNTINVVLFISRNKDNQNIDGFYERRESVITTWSYDDPRLMTMFHQFVNRGLDNELSRFYVSVNARYRKKTLKQVLHYLIDHEDDVNLASINTIVAKMAIQRNNAAEKKRLFDFDIDNEDSVNEFIHDLTSRGAEDVLKVKTLNGYAVVINRGVDLRGLVDTMPDVPLKSKKDKGPWKWSPDNVTYKVDDLLLVTWDTKR